jgi:hypothetical protein
MGARGRAFWGRVIVAAVCWGLCIADYSGFLVYHPSGRDETTFERIAHTLPIGGGAIIGSFFYVMAVLKAK